MEIREFPRVNVEGGARLIIVGDVHGCSTELDQLLDKVRFVQGRDVLLLLGDLVNKGVDSEGVVRRAMSIPNCYAILGNHDVKLLGTIRSLRSGAISEREQNPFVQLALTFPDDCAEYLRNLPHVYRIPQFNLIAVHAGLNPALPLEDQKLWEVLHMRTIDHEGVVAGKRVVTDKPDDSAQPWAKLWRGPETVIFGHDAEAKLQIEPFAIGLDTGCCDGEKLSAMVYPGKELVQVNSGVPKRPTAAEKFHPCYRVYKACKRGAGCEFAGYPFKACIYHLRGDCKSGHGCTFLHIDFTGPKSHPNHSALPSLPPVAAAGSTSV